MILWPLKRWPPERRVIVEYLGSLDEGDGNQVLAKSLVSGGVDCSQMEGACAREEKRTKDDEIISESILFVLVDIVLQ